MKKHSGLSPAAVVFKVYPEAFWNMTNAIVRVSKITSLDGDRQDRMTRYVLQKIATLISQEKYRIDEYFKEAQRRKKLQKDNQTEEPEEDLLSTLDDNFGDIDFTDNDIETVIAQPVKPQNINFILVDDQANVRTRIFPRTFHCKNCGHFEAIDPSKAPSSLKCPCCHQGVLIQEPIVFGCVKCANIHELTPKGPKISDRYRKTQNTKDYLGGPPPCPDCLQGHIHLEKHGTNSIQQWQWYCNKCSFYHENVQESCLNCYMPPGDDANQQKQIIAMNAFPASASNALRPLIDVQMFIRNEPLDPESLHTARKELVENWPHYFELQRVKDTDLSLSKDDIEQITQACIQNAYLLNHVRVITTVYGYRAGGIMNNRRNPVSEDERLARFFPDPEKFVEYVCYGMMNEGIALVLQLDKNLILNRLGELYPHINNMTYEQILEEERNMLTMASLRDLLQSHGSQFPLITALHGMEHAIQTNAIQQVGNEVLGSKLFLSAGIILLYEREPVGHGGIIQLVNGGPGLLSLIKASGDHVTGCAQGCADGCPSCLYIQDMYCEYRYEDLGRSWLPANTLLSRIGARKLLQPDLMI